jgi:hypothetical protein
MIKLEIKILKKTKKKLQVKKLQIKVQVILFEIIQVFLIGN